MNKMFKKFNDKKININYIPDNRFKFIVDTNIDTIVKGQTCEFTFKVVALREEYIEDVIMEFKMGIHKYLIKNKSELKFTKCEEGLYITAILSAEDTDNVVYGREMKAQLRIELKDGRVLMSNIDNIKIIPSIIDIKEN